MPQNHQVGSLGNQSSPWALLSVSNKEGIVTFAKELLSLGYRLLSTGGTADILRREGLAVKEVSDHTLSPEILEGRVKTLHPKIHGGLLYDRDKVHHAEDVRKLGIEAIDLVAVNLYPFEDNVPSPDVPLAHAIEWIDVGGPSMLRAAAKNHKHVITVVDPKDYPKVLSTLKTKEELPALRLQLAAKVFDVLSHYDAKIASYLHGQVHQSPATKPVASFPAKLIDLELLKDGEKKLDLRYGENPQQKAAFYGHTSWGGLSASQLLQGKELSYNNILDLDASWQLALEFGEQRAVVIVKHTNPCGVALAHSKSEPLADIVARARACDGKSAFGGIVASNQMIDAPAAIAITENFMECVCAPDFTPEALAVFSKKPALRVLKMPKKSFQRELFIRSVCGGLLVQEADDQAMKSSHWRQVAGEGLSDHANAELLFAFQVVKHVKSNGIVLVKNGQTIGIGAGQMSRIDAAELAVKKALSSGFSTEGAYLASDAFFPFGDTVEFAAKHGVKALIQPGGSMRDQESIDAAQKHSMSMIFTGVRHFRH